MKKQGARVEKFVFIFVIFFVYLALSESLGNPGTYLKQDWCYAVFAIHYELIYEPFNSKLPSAGCQEVCKITSR